MFTANHSPYLTATALPYGAVPQGRQAQCVLSACIRAWAVAVWLLSGIRAASDVLPE